MKKNHLMRCSLNEDLIEKLDDLPLSYTNKNKWTECLAIYFPDLKINSSSYKNISFLTIKNSNNQEDFIAYWNDTLKIGNIIHPYIVEEENYNDFMQIIISKEQLNSAISNDINEKQKTYKI